MVPYVKPTNTQHTHLLHIVADGTVITPRTHTAHEHDLVQTIADYVQNLHSIGIQVMTSPGFAGVSERMMRQHLPQFQQQG